MNEAVQYKIDKERKNCVTCVAVYCAAVNLGRGAYKHPRPTVPVQLVAIVLM